MPNNDRMICINKIEQSIGATEKIITYMAEIKEIFLDDEKKFQRSHQALKDQADIIAEIALMLQNALKQYRSTF